MFEIAWGRACREVRSAQRSCFRSHLMRSQGKQMLRTKLVCSTAIAVAAMTAPALAQIEEITVTARKVEERLLDTPIAINAFTGEDIAARNIVSFQDLAQNTPGTNVVNQASGGGPC